MALAEDVIFHLPQELISRSHGFALDIGGSIAKVLYRSKDEYQGGKCKDNGELGKVHMVSFPRDNIDDLVKFLKQKCDITSDEKGEVHVFTTGFGGNFYKEKLQIELGVRTHNANEFDYFGLAFSSLAPKLAQDKLFLPISQEVLEYAAACCRIFEKQDTYMGMGNITVPEPYTLPDKPDDYFPCLIVLAGSGNPFIKVEKDGSYLLTDFPILGGRFFLGFSKMCCGVEDYEEIEDLIAKSDEGKSCDALLRDLVPTSEDNISGEPDGYAGFLPKTPMEKKVKENFRIFPFGKATMPGFTSATKGDMLYSLQKSIAEEIGMTAFLTTFRMDVRNVFFCGNFVSTPRVRDFITVVFHMMNLKLKPEERRNFRFVKHGGHYGAIGCFLSQRKS